MTKARVPLVFGAATFGTRGPFIRINTASEAQIIVDVFVGRGYNTLDTARFYGAGTSEEILGQLDIKGSKIDTKIHPTPAGSHSPEKLQIAIAESEKALAPHKINVYYLHAPDRSVDYEDTLREINELYKAGHFKEFGLSNFLSWEVVEFVSIARRNGWVQPTVYQGVYNTVSRTIEPELIPCLRKYGIRFYAYSPLAGGLLSGIVLKEEDFDAKERKGGRFDASSWKGANHLREKYGPLLPSFVELQSTLEAHGIKMGEAALRWLQHHSALTPEDAVILGARDAKQLESNITDSEGGPLPDSVVKALDDVWLKAKSTVPYYASA